MDYVARWTVSLFVFDHNDSVSVRAELRTPATTLEGHGHAQLVAGDPNVPEIGDGVAAARALADLADQLLLQSDSDLQALLRHAELERRRHAELPPGDHIDNRPDGHASSPAEVSDPSQSDRR